MSTLLAPLAVHLAHDHPSLTIRLVEFNPADAFDLVFSGEADLAINEATPDNRR